MSGIGTPRDDMECESGWDEDGTGEDEDTGSVTKKTHTHKAQLEAASIMCQWISRWQVMDWSGCARWCSGGRGSRSSLSSVTED